MREICRRFWDNAECVSYVGGFTNMLNARDVLQVPRSR